MSASPNEADAWFEQLDRWSSEQDAIFDWFERGSGNMLVRARAGVGKTTSLIEGVQRAPEQSILLAAFNKSIATELQSRIRTTNVDAKTLHGLGYAFIRRAWPNVKIDRDHAMLLAKGALPNNAPIQVVRLVRDLHTQAREVDPWALPNTGAPGPEHRQRIIDIAERFDLMPDEATELRGWTMDKVVDAVLLAMHTATLRSGSIDFADMIFLPLWHGWVRATYDMVVIDEAQDMTIAQLAMAVGACNKNGRIAVFGDCRQCVYQFRGAELDGIDRLKAQLGAHELGLKTTYRCAKKVVEVAQQFVPDFVAHPTAPDGEVDEIDLAKMIAEAKPGDFVLSRKNAPLVRVCVALLKRGTRAQIKGSDFGKGVLALVEQLRPRDVDELAQKVVEWCAKACARATSRMSEEAAAERVGQLVDQRDIVIALLEDVDDLAAFYAKARALFSDAPGADAVVCSSIHRAKGLEADTVFVLRSTLRTDSLGEQNLYYVAVTRAKRRLVFVDGEIA